MQVRLKTLFVFTFIVALLCAALFALPGTVSCLVFFTVGMLTPAATIAAIVYGRKAVRAFAIGVLASGGWALWCLPLLIAAPPIISSRVSGPSTKKWRSSLKLRSSFTMACLLWPD